MAITIDGAGTITGLSATGISSQPVFAGQVLQVVSVMKTDFFSTTSSSYVDVPGVSATLTPLSASSKVLVMISGGSGAAGEPNQYAYGVLVRDSTQIAIGDARGSAQRATFDLAFAVTPAYVDMAKHFSVTHLDSPATTSAVTYKMQVKATLNTVGIGGSTSTSDGNRSNLPTIITLMEIAG